MGREGWKSDVWRGKKCLFLVARRDLCEREGSPGVARKNESDHTVPSLPSSSLEAISRDLESRSAKRIG